VLPGQGKSMYMFSTQHRRISPFRLLALTIEPWRGAESGMLQKTYTLIYPDPMLPSKAVFVHDPLPLSRSKVTSKILFLADLTYLDF
jgi:hypothetical protein